MNTKGFYLVVYLIALKTHFTFINQYYGVNLIVNEEQMAYH